MSCLIVQGRSFRSGGQLLSRFSRSSSRRWYSASLLRCLPRTNRLMKSEPRDSLDRGDDAVFHEVCEARPGRGPGSFILCEEISWP
jgi:hypothetical protein